MGVTEGTIVKGIGGFYYVRSVDKTYQCKARGIFRKDGMIPYVGDRVEIEPLVDEEAVITRILPRKNQFIRPPVANVDCFIITAALRKPELNLYIIDTFLVMAEYHQTEIGICLNKIDLAESGEIEAFKEIYEGLYPVMCVSGKTGEGLDELRKFLAGKKSAFAGPSGVGKSTLLNRLVDATLAETGEISEKLQRGKHTTRHVELFRLSDDSLIFDTPGFTSFEVLDADEQELAFLYPEMVPFAGQCRYYNCRHLSEPDCKVRDAVEEGRIHPFRYDSYCRQIKEIQEMRKY
ncbi:MAG: ribosome small subunit-dependent GTPase A [Bacillota bacterium]|jgi:ribosome biogenesis GTPase|nr:ribosome small subunit-dependent GTPase A [Bacillota bacterium]NLM07482.1 ribosome small subunit-dependent GTPase A [Clostridiales Family XIII bacterium]